MQAQIDAWEPGHPIRLRSRRLLLRSLTEGDLSGDLSRWAGSQRRTVHVWKPPCEAREYFAGMARGCDHVLYFLVGIFLRRSERLIGYWKAQVLPEGRMLVPTAVVGDEALAGYALGTEASRVLQRLLIQRLDLAGLRSRVYADNEKVQSLLLRLGYRPTRKFVEQHPETGVMREGVVFELSKREWFERSAEIDRWLASLPDPEGRGSDEGALGPHGPAVDAGPHEQ